MARTVGADRRIDLGDGRDAFDQGAQVKAGAAAEDRQLPGRVCRMDFGAGVGRPGRHRAGVRAVPIAVEPVRHARFVLSRGPGGDDPEVAIDLRAVGIDDHAAKAFCQRQGERRLAARRSALR